MFPRKTANVCDKNEKCLWERTRATLCEKTTQRSHTNSIRTRSSVRRGIAHTPIAILPATACGAQWCVRGFCMTQKKPKYHQLAHPSLGMSGGARLSCPLQATAMWSQCACAAKYNELHSWYTVYHSNAADARRAVQMERVRLLKRMYIDKADFALPTMTLWNGTVLGDGGGMLCCRNSVNSWWATAITASL